MKKILSTLSAFFIFAALTLTSCGGFLGTDITDQSAVDSNLRSKLSEVLGNDTRIIDISFSFHDGSNFTKTITGASVNYFDPESNELKCKWITLSGKVEGKDRPSSSRYINDDDGKLTIKPEDYQKLSEIDFSKLAANATKAGEMVEKSENEFSGLGTYDIATNTDPAKVKHTFTIESRQGSKTTTTSRGLGTEITYLTFDFIADSEGNVTLKE